MRKLFKSHEDSEDMICQGLADNIFLDMTKNIKFNLLSLSLKSHRNSISFLKFMDKW